MVRVLAEGIFHEAASRSRRGYESSFTDPQRRLSRTMKSREIPFLSGRSSPGEVKSRLRRENAWCRKRKIRSAERYRSMARRLNGRELSSVRVIRVKRIVFNAIRRQICLIFVINLWCKSITTGNTILIIANNINASSATTTTSFFTTNITTIITCFTGGTSSRPIPDVNFITDDRINIRPSVYRSPTDAVSTDSTVSVSNATVINTNSGISTVGVPFIDNTKTSHQRTGWLRLFR